LQHENLHIHEGNQDSFAQFRHIPLLLLTALAVGFVVYQRIHRCIRPSPPFEANDGDTVVEEEPPDDDDDDFDKHPRNDVERREEEEGPTDERHIDETHTYESSHTDGVVESSDR